MDKANLLQVISKPSSLSEKDLDQLEEIVASYPYCQIAHLLIAKYSHSKSSLLAPQKIRRAAAYAYSRNRFRQLIENELDLADEQTDIQIKTHFEQIDNQPGVQEEEELETTSPPTEPLDSEEKIETEKEDTSQPEVSFFDTLEVEEQKEDEAKEDISEEQAANYLQEGKKEEAIRVYKQLILLNPHKETYYQSQLDVIEENPTDSPQDDEVEIEESPVENVHSFFDDIDDLPKKPYLSDSLTHDRDLEPETTAQPEIETSTSVEENNPISETYAADLYNQGRTEEAVEVYRQLIAENPDKIDHYVNQIGLISNEEQAAQIRKEFVKENKESLSEEAVEPIQLSEDVPSSASFFEQIEVENTSVEPIEIDQESSIESQSFFSQVAEETKEEPTQEEPAIESQSFFSQVAADDSPANVSESQAIMHFNKGEYQKAIEVYEQLKSQNPQNASHYIREINIIKNNISQFTEPEPTQEQVTFTEPEVPTQPIPTNNDLKKPQIEGIDPDEELQEHHAFSLCSEGKLEDALKIYDYLIQKFPEKESYYRDQVEILKS